MGSLGSQDDNSSEIEANERRLNILMEREETSQQSELNEEYHGREEFNQLCGEDEPVPMSTQRADWRSITPKLRIPRNPISIENYGENLMKIPSAKYLTMDAFSKCWQVIPPRSPKLLTNETDGTTWVFCESCVAQIPKMIQEMLFFFHSLKVSLYDLKFFAVPSKHVSIGKKRGDKRVFSDLVWNRLLEHNTCQLSSDEDDEIDINKVYLERTNELTEQAKNIRVPPVKITLGFTGATFVHEKEPNRKLFCVLMITCARNFDLLGYINDKFLREPCKQSQNYRQRMEEVQRLSYIFKKGIRTVAMDNLGLDETKFMDIETYSEDRGGEMGADSLFNMFTIPLQIRGIIKREILEKLQRERPSMTIGDVKIERLKIVGMPELPLRTDEITSDYIRYMHTYVSNASSLNDAFQKHMASFYKVLESEKRKKDDKGKEEESDDAFALMGMQDLACPGGWPLAQAQNVEGDLEYTEFGLPPLPIMLIFKPEITPDVSNFETWLVTIGGPSGIPELVKACLRCFFVQELGSEDNCWDHFLEDGRLANAALVLQKYYSESANPLSSLITPGYLRWWWLGLRKEVKSQRAQGLGVGHAALSVMRYLRSSLQYHRSDINAGAFRSPRIVQALQIIDRVKFKKACVEHDTLKEGVSIQALMRKITEGMSRTLKFDPYHRANETFWKTFERLNYGFMLNSSNLEFFEELMVSQLMWLLGPQNDTVSAYFQCIKIICGNGHFTLSTKDGSFPDERKPNSTGMDWTLGRVTELFQMMLDIAGIMDPKNNLQGPQNMLGWTPAAMLYMTTALVSGNKVTCLPEERMNYRSVVNTEMGRGEDKKVFIKVIPRNADDQQRVFINTGDLNKDNFRQQQMKIQTQLINFCAVSSNVPTATQEDAEQARTLNAVMHLMPPGSGPPNKRRKTTDFTNIECNAYSGRHSKPENAEAICHALAFSHIYATAIPALMNNVGSIPFEIAPTVLGFLDWVFLYIKENTKKVLGKEAFASFKRIKDGTEGRLVTKCLWTKTIMYLANSESEEEAALKILQGMHVNAMSLHEVAATAHSFLTRSVHMGALLIIACIARHLEVPIVTVDSLRRFFDSDEVCLFRIVIRRRLRMEGNTASVEDRIKILEDCIQEIRREMRIMQQNNINSLTPITNLPPPTRHSRRGNNMT